MTLTLNFHLTSLTHLVECFTNFETYGCYSLQKLNTCVIFTFSHTKAEFDLGVKWVKVNLVSSWQYLPTPGFSFLAFK